MSENPTMDDYLDGVEQSDPPTDECETPTIPGSVCEHCGRSFEDFGVRASKVLRKHQEFHGCPEAPDDHEDGES